MLTPDGRGGPPAPSYAETLVLHPTGLLARAPRRGVDHAREWAASLAATALVVTVVVIGGGPEDGWTLVGAAQAALVLLVMAVALALRATGSWRRVTLPVTRQAPARRRASLLALAAGGLGSLPAVLLFPGLPPIGVAAWSGFLLLLICHGASEAWLRRIERDWAGTPFWSGPLPGDPPVPNEVREGPRPAPWPLGRSTVPGLGANLARSPVAEAVGSFAGLWALAIGIGLSRDDPSGSRMLLSGGILLAACALMALDARIARAQPPRAFGGRVARLAANPRALARSVTGSGLVMLGVLVAFGPLALDVVAPTFVGLLIGAGLIVVAGRSSAADRG